MTPLLLALALLQGSAPGAAVGPPPSYPWAVGEKLTYSAKLGMLTLFTLLRLDVFALYTQSVTMYTRSSAMHGISPPKIWGSAPS